MMTMNKKAVLVTVVLIIIACTMWHMTVMAKGSKTIASREDLSEIEMIYKENIRTKLDMMGFNNAGITLTSVNNADGTVEYSSSIHHRRIDRMDENERIELKKELDIMAYQNEYCSFHHEFLIYDEE